MENIECRAVIKYFVLKGWKATQIQTDFIETLGERAPSLKTISKWVNEFKRGRESLEDDPRSGRPKTATTPEIVEKVHKILMSDRRLKLQQIAEMVGISKERVHVIVVQELGMKKLSARWVPRLLSDDQKKERARVCKSNLKRLKRNKRDFLRRLVTGDETWVHHVTPETKEQSRQWKHSGSPCPKKAKVVLSAGKVMASVFWDSQGLLLIDYLPKGQTINGEYYVDLLDKLDTAIRKKRPHLAKKKIIFQHDNARPHTCALTTAKLAKLKYDILPHPPYSPDLAPSDYYLFPKLKKELGGKRFQSKEDLETFVNGYFEDLPQTAYHEGIAALESRWTKCILLKGDYVEK